MSSCLPTVPSRCQIIYLWTLEVRLLLLLLYLSDHFVALVEPWAVAWHAVKASPFTPSSCVLVMGAGPIGLAVLQVLKARDARTIIVAEVSSRRKQFAKQFGADHVLDPTKDDIASKSK